MISWFSPFEQLGVPQVTPVIFMLPAGPQPVRSQNHRITE